MLRTYDVLVKSFTLKRQPTHHTRWVRGVKAETLSQASKTACKTHENLGCVPTTMSTGWEVFKGARNESRRIA